MDPRITQVTEYLDKVATKLGLGASEIWPWLIKQQYIEPLMYLVFVPFAGFASWWLFKQIDVANKKAEDGEWTSTEAKNTKEPAETHGLGFEHHPCCRLRTICFRYYRGSRVS